jgi:hypothetical protein
VPKSKTTHRLLSDAFSATDAAAEARSIFGRLEAMRNALEERTEIYKDIEETLESGSLEQLVNQRDRLAAKIAEQKNRKPRSVD